MIITEIGEVGIDLNGQKSLLRPSLYAMTQIGDADEIVRVYASIMSDLPHPDRLPDACKAIYACCEEDISEAFGCMEYNEFAKRFEFKKGAANEHDTIVIARALMKHGLIGDFEIPVSAEKDSKNYNTKFDARKYASLAVAHLGSSTKEAWQMTMTEIVGALQAKFPPKKASGADAPSKEDLEETLEWHDRVLAARDKQ